MSLCPNCRERMSPVEQGLGGIWSCLYCEGSWLFAAQLEALASANRSTFNPHENTDQAFQVGSAAESLACPSCESVELEAVYLGAAHAYRCPQCYGAFFKKSVLAACAPQIFSAAQEAPVVGALLGVIGTVAMLGDPLLLIAALAYQPRAKSAL